MDRPISEDVKKSRRKKAVMKWGGVAAVVVMLVAEILTKHGFRYALATNKATQLTSFAIYF